MSGMKLKALVIWSFVVHFSGRGGYINESLHLTGVWGANVLSWRIVGAARMLLNYQCKGKVVRRQV